MLRTDRQTVLAIEIATNVRGSARQSLLQKRLQKASRTKSSPPAFFFLLQKINAYGCT